MRWGFDQNSPVHPILGSREGTLSVKDVRTNEGRKSLCLILDYNDPDCPENSKANTYQPKLALVKLTRYTGSVKYFISIFGKLWGTL